MSKFGVTPVHSMEIRRGLVNPIITSPSDSRFRPGSRHSCPYWVMSVRVAVLVWPPDTPDKVTLVVVDVGVVGVVGVVDVGGVPPPPQETREPVKRIKPIHTMLTNNVLRLPIPKKNVLTPTGINMIARDRSPASGLASCAEADVVTETVKLAGEPLTLTLGELGVHPLTGAGPVHVNATVPTKPEIGAMTTL